ncbi:hypothetical protein ACJ6X8_01450 [Pseudomonas alvandae]|uniref:hypothetical protein n=1 Tax=Pseudomonas TaxID=286 RepID=UPI00389A2C27
MKSVSDMEDVDSEDGKKYTIRAEEGPLWADLEVRCWWSGESKFYARPLRYRAGSNNRKSGNAELKLKSLNEGGWSSLIGDKGIQDGAWHDMSGSTHAATGNGISAVVNFHWIYDINDGPDPHLYGAVEVRYVAPPRITKPASGLVVLPGQALSFEGTGTNTAKVTVYHADSGEALSDPVDVKGGIWAAPLIKPLLSGANSITAKQVLDGMPSDWSGNVTVTLLTKPVILKPKTSTTVGRWPAFSGTGVPGATLQLYVSDTDEIVPPARTVNKFGEFSISRLTNILAIGDHQFTAKQTLNGQESDRADSIAVKVVSSTPPEITDPPAGSVQDRNFWLKGIKGRLGFSVKVFRDGGEDLFGTNLTILDDWTCAVIIPAGPVSVVAILANSQEETDRSPARAFKIRPPKLSGISTYPSNTTIKFSGLGYFGATIEITVDSGPTVRPPPLADVKEGEWETTATDWPFGNYRLQAIQKVPDRASGWIESEPYYFYIDVGLPDVSEVSYTPEYRPEFSGKGFNGAMVRLVDVPDGTNKVAPDARVSGERWSSPASEVWGPTLKRKVYIKQFLSEESEEWSPTWVEVEVTIPPLAPGMGDPVDNGLSPNFSGTCWPGATLKLTFNDDGVMRTVIDDDNDGRWAFRRDTPFEPDVSHTATLIQTAAEQDSPETFKVFSVSLPMLKPVITYPGPDDMVGRDVIVRGDNGMAGATMQLHDVQFGRPLGEPKLLTADGEWSIELFGLEFRKYFLRAEQELNGQSSERSDQRVFNVVLLPPEFDVPQPGGNLPRTSELSGRGIPNGRVTVWLQGQADPLRENIFVNSSGHWKAEVTLPIGSTTVRARQFFIDEKGNEQTSDFSSWLTYNVVPAAPFIETPATGEHIGSNVVVSGFGMPGDTVTVRLNDASRTVLASGPVLEDRTWSVRVTLETPGGAHELLAVAQCEGFESADSGRAVVLGTYVPSIDRPAAGRWVDNPVTFEGRGRAGSGRVVSWYNPELDWAAALGVTAGQWQGEATQTLVSGGQWCRFKQTLTSDADGATVSDWVESGRFDVK